MYLQTVSHRRHHGYPHTLLLGYLEMSQDNCHIDQNLALFHDLLACHIDQNLALFHDLLACHIDQNLALFHDLLACHIDQNLALFHDFLACLAKYLPHEHVKIPNAQTQFGWVNITVKIIHITP